jgi:hypothetical protein
VSDSVSKNLRDPEDFTSDLFKTNYATFVLHFRTDFLALTPTAGSCRVHLKACVFVQF